MITQEIFVNFSTFSKVKYIEMLIILIYLLSSSNIF